MIFRKALSTMMTLCFLGQTTVAQTTSIKNLELLLVEAQTAYFTENDLGKAQKSFEKIATLKTESSLSPSQQRAIHYSMLRLSQLSEDEQTKESWLTEAIHFAPHLQPEEEIFPPPLVDKYSEIRNQFLTKTSPPRPLIVPPLKDLKLESQSVASSDSETSPLNKVHSSKEKTQNIKKILKNKWLWIGVGVVAASILIHQKSQAEKSPNPATPSVTHGL